MLSPLQQEFLIHLLYKQANYSEGAVANEFGIYKNNTSFYQAISYLHNSELIEKNKKSKKTTYALTIEGELLARALLNLADVKEDQIKQTVKYNSIKNA